MGLRVLHAIPFLWSGAGAVVTRLCTWQAPHHRVALASSGRAGNLHDWPAYRRRLRAAGVRHHRIELFHRDQATVWRAVSEVERLIREFRPDLVHAHAGVPTLAAVLARQRLGSRVPVLAHMYSWAPDRPRWMDEMDLWAFGRADHVVCSARAYETRLRQGGVRRRNLSNVPWGVDERFRAVRTRVTAPSPPTVGFVGRLEPRKGQLLLVRALPRIRELVPGTRLELVGPVAEAEYADEIRREIARRHLRGAVRLVGHATDPVPWVARWQLLVSLSCDEGQGMAVLEAMAAGVPVAARRVPGVEDYLRDGRTGFVLDDAVPQKLGERIARILQAQDARSLVAGRARAMIDRRFRWTRTVERLDRIYSRLSSSPGDSRVARAR